MGQLVAPMFEVRVYWPKVPIHCRDFVRSFGCGMVDVLFSFPAVIVCGSAWYMVMTCAELFLFALDLAPDVLLPGMFCGPVYAFASSVFGVWLLWKRTGRWFPGRACVWFWCPFGVPPSSIDSRDCVRNWVLLVPTVVFAFGVFLRLWLLVELFVAWLISWKWPIVATLGVLRRTISVWFEMPAGNWLFVACFYVDRTAVVL